MAAEMRYHDDHQFTLITQSSTETFEAGKALGEVLSEGDVVALVGELGAGKTCFTQGIARGLGVSDAYEITSPTFTLMNEYPGRIRLYHFDLYRIRDRGDLYDTGYDEYLLGKGVVVIEWADKARECIPEEALWIRIDYVNDHKRKIELSEGTPVAEQFIKAWGKGEC